MQAAFGDTLAPEDRIGPNADLWRADQEEYMKKIGGKRDREEEEEGVAGPDAKKTKSEKKTANEKKSLIPIPYKRYIPDNLPFREFLYSYKQKENESRRKLRQLKTQKKKIEKATEGEETEESLTEKLNKFSLRKTKLSICSFVVRVSLVPEEFHVKWAQDIAHVFGLSFAPVKDTLSGAWLFPSNDPEDAANILKLLKSVRLIDAELNSTLHYAAAAIPKVATESIEVINERLKLFSEKYDNAIARNMQEQLDEEESCSFFRSDWRNAYLGGLKSLYSAVADLVRSLAKKQVSGGRKWCSEGVRGVVLVADVKVAVWCGMLLGSMAGKKDISLVGGEEISLSDVEHADIIVGTAAQLLPILSRGDREDNTQNLLSPTKRKKSKHLLSHVCSVILDDVHKLMDILEAKQVLSLIKEKSRKCDGIETVAVARRIRFDELEMAERSVGCKFPRTALLEPTGEDLSLDKAMEEELLFHSDDDDGEEEETVKSFDNSKTNAQMKQVSKPQFKNPPKKSNTDLRNRKRINERNDGKNGKNYVSVDDPNAVKDSEESVPEATKMRGNKRALEEEVAEELPRQLTFMEELDLYKSEQKRRKLEGEEEHFRQLKKDLEKKMAVLKEEQKKRLEEERKADLEAKRLRRLKEEEERRKREKQNVPNVVEKTKTSATGKGKMDQQGGKGKEGKKEKVKAREVSLAEHLAIIRSQGVGRGDVDSPAVEGERQELQASSPAIENNSNQSEQFSEKGVQGEENDGKAAGKDTSLKLPPKSSDKSAKSITTPTPSSKPDSESGTKSDKKIPESKSSNCDSTRTKSSKGGEGKTAEQIKKLEQKKKLQEEKRKLEERIQREILKRQQNLKSEDMRIQQEKERKLLQEKLYQQQLLLQNKLMQEKKKKKKLEAQAKKE